MKVLPIQQLITLNTLIVMYNSHTGHLPHIFKTLFVINSSVHPHNTRQTMLLHKPPVRTTHALNSFQNVGISKWNNLSSNIRSSTTLTRFKKLCKSELFTILSSYWVDWIFSSLLLSFLFLQNLLWHGMSVFMHGSWGEGGG